MNDAMLPTKLITWHSDLCALSPGSLLIDPPGCYHERVAGLSVRIGEDRALVLSSWSGMPEQGPHLSKIGQDVGCFAIAASDHQWLEIEFDLLGKSTEADTHRAPSGTLVFTQSGFALAVFEGGGGFRPWSTFVDINTWSIVDQPKRVESATRHWQLVLVDADADVRSPIFAPEGITLLSSA